MPSEMPENFIPGSVVVEFGNELLHLLPDRAIWWPFGQALIVADVHLGKDAAFRKAGFPVPAGGSVKDLGRLDHMLAMTGARRLIVLGDLIHAKHSYQPELFEAVLRWRQIHSSIEMLLVRGNHDRSAGLLPVEWDIREMQELTGDSGLMLSHQPRYDQNLPVLAGHIHPVVILRDHDRSTVRVPCFVFDEKCCAILPAFGTFTGGHPMDRQAGRRLFLTSGKKVVAVK